ncbi:DEAD/DEAH box helicase family protein [Sphingomonas sp. CL5.1]|uniref:DEAD/DEAH box helicase family protein n=1 Tax=Sphingomonas sp. CL5.1 TaxID=2653203 RepID=UPI0015823CE8|nr:DEAD/DEAH box helicase family protein [Sphingomonas sp. CL5.1]QKS00127.1 DEAD/DEAH box helicase family protein [Sphingomonas sp. CL5.1]
MTDLSRDDRLRRQVAQRLSLRKPQEEGLHILGDVAGMIDWTGTVDPVALLDEVKARYPSVESFERAFPSLAFALATGVGKTRLMGAFIAWLYLTGRSKNFFVLAPNTTIYDKLVTDFSRQSSAKYVFRGIAEFAQTPPIIVTGDTWEEGRGIRGSDLFGGEAIINIFNVDKINKEKGRIRSFRETLGESYFDYLSRLPDLVMLMDEAHRYRAKAAANAVFELAPRIGLELTATPKTVGASPKDFKNVVYSYGLGQAMADGYVKEPAVATRADFRPDGVAPEELERIMLADGITYHEHVKVELDLYARQSGRQQVHPFMLVVARDTAHASAIRAYLESEEFHDGAYRGRVIEVHSNQTGEESNDAMARLVGLEHDAQTDIVVHVNKLKEGWDVTNLYTIVPLRASASEILTEQTLGRGLRLPYGVRTGVEAVDTLTVIAHDRFDEVIKRAKEPGSIVRLKEITIGEGGDVTPEAREVMTVPTAFEAALTGRLPEMGGGVVAEERADYIPPTPEKVAYVDTTLALIRDKFERKLTGGLADLKKPEVQAEIAHDVRAATAAAQGSFDTLLGHDEVEQLIAQIAVGVADNTIEIPEIVVLPSREVNFWFDDFDLDGLDTIRFRPSSDTILIRNLRDDSQRELARSNAGPREKRPEDYIIRHLMDFPEVDYDSHAAKLYKWASQVIERLRAYLGTEEEVEAVALEHGQALARFVFEQMRRHYRETPVEYRATRVRSFKALKPQQLGVSLSKKLLLTEAATPLSSTPGILFYGSKKSPYQFHKFDSDPERRFAALIDSSNMPGVLRWLRPAAGQFDIEYDRGRRYEPDFVVECSDRKLIVEVKAHRDMTDAVVLEKARAARAWVMNANQFAAEGDGKEWGYALLSEHDVTESMTLAGLLAKAA